MSRTVAMSQKSSKPSPPAGVDAPAAGGVRAEPASANNAHPDCRLESLIDALPALAWTSRPDGAAEYFNRRWLDFTGLPLSDALAWGWLTAIHPEDRASLLESWHGRSASAEAFEIEARMRRFDGGYRWFLIRANAVRDESGSVQRWCGTNIDIEDRRRAEQAVRASEQHFRLLFDSVPALLTTTTPAGEVESVNQSLLGYLGKSLEEIRAWQLNDVLHPDDLERVIDQWRAAIASGQRYDLDLRLRRADGVYRWFHYVAVPLRDIDGELIRWYAVLSDIDRLKQSEAAARSSEHRVRLIVDSVPGMLFTTTPQGEVEFVNRRLLDYFGRSLEELQAWKQAEWVHPEDLPRTMMEWQRGVTSGQPYDFEERLRRADGAYRWFHFRAAPLRDADGQITRWYGLLTDIEDLKRADEALRSAQMRLSRATHLAALSELSASIAHEVNQPLAAVVTNANACLRWLSADPPNLERAVLSAARIIRDGNGAAEVITRMRSLFKRAPPVKQPLDLNETIREVCDLAAEDARARGIQLQTDLQHDLPHVTADRVQIQQVIANIARNGMDAMNTVTRPKQLTITSRSTAEELVVSVIDAGEGLIESELLFEPLYTTKPNGMGMGLAICRSIIEAHGGRLWMQRNPSHGATFSFALALAGASA